MIFAFKKLIFYATINISFFLILLIGLQNSSKKSKHLFNSISYSIKNNKIFVINGNTYDTKDGTCIRDLIDVQDLVYIIYFFVNNKKKIRENIFNLGINKGYSVLEIVKKFQKVLKVNINYKIGAIRKGDIPELTCSNSLLKKYYKFNFSSLFNTIRNHYKFYKRLK